VLAGVLIVAAGGVCGWALTKSRPDLTPLAAAYTPPVLADSSEGSLDGSPTPSSSPAATSAAPVGPRVVFVGDSYTASAGVSHTRGFPALVGKAEGWDVSVVACSGAGYVTAGTCGTAYAGLIPDVVAQAPSIVVVTGGRYDTPSYGSSAAAATSFYSQLAAALPQAKIYAISPVWDATHGQHPLGVVQASVQAGATAAGASYLDIGEPLRDHPELIGPGGVIPDAAGYAALAAAIEQALPKK